MNTNGINRTQDAENEIHLSLFIFVDSCLFVVEKKFNSFNTKEVKK
jgi:hypothetical protein